MNALESCPTCKDGVLLRRVHQHVTAVAGKKVTDGTAAVRTCTKCGEVVLSAAEVQGYELRAAALLLRDGRFVDGRAMKFARKALGLRQTDLAALLEVRAETVSAWETGDEIPRPSQLAVVALLDAMARGDVPRVTKAASLGAMRASRGRGG